MINLSFQSSYWIVAKQSTIGNYTNLKLDDLDAPDGDVDLSNQKLINVGQPTETHHAVNKQYVDNILVNQSELVSNDQLQKIYARGVGLEMWPNNQLSFYIRQTYKSGDTDQTFRVLNNS